MSGHTLRILGLVLAGLIVVAFIGIRIAFARMLNTGGVPEGAMQKKVTSKDGTIIAYEQTGSGPPLVLISAALVDRDGQRPLARRLSAFYTVINYDRRGRGDSTDTTPYSEERELEDLDAVVETAGRPVFLFGSSSGAVLALDAASRLGAKVKKAFLYEPPFIVDSSRPPIPGTLGNDVAAAVNAGDRNGAVRIFFTQAMGIPGPGVTFMRLLMPAWSDMTRIAHTAPYDLMILEGTQSGRPLPPNRWNRSTSPVLAAVGSKSEPFFHSGAKSLREVLPSAQYRRLEGLDHGAVLMAPDALAAAVRDFFNQPE